VADGKIGERIAVREQAKEKNGGKGSKKPLALAGDAKMRRAAQRGNKSGHGGKTSRGKAVTDSQKGVCGC
jgi:hypothetical protein